MSFSAPSWLWMLLAVIPLLLLEWQIGRAHV